MLGEASPLKGDVMRSGNENNLRTGRKSQNDEIMCTKWLVGCPQLSHNWFTILSMVWLVGGLIIINFSI